MRFHAATTILIILLASGIGQTEPIPVVQIKPSKPITYEAEVRGIFAQKCLVCHSSKVRRGRLDLSSWEKALQGGKSGRVIIPGQPEKSLLIRMTGHLEEPFMPPPKKEPLTPKELALLKLWVNQGAKQGVKATVTIRPLPPTVRTIRAMAFHPNRSILAVGRANHIHLLEIPSGKLSRSLQSAETGSAHRSIVEAIAMSSNGKFLASGSYREMALWDLSTGELLQAWTDFPDRVTALDFSPDGKLLAVGGGQPTVGGDLRLYSIPDRKLLIHLKEAHSDTILGARFDPSGKRMATCGADMAIRIFSLPNGKLLKTLQGHSHHVLDVDWQSNGKRLISTGADKKIRLWDYETGEELKKINRGGGRLTIIAIDMSQPANRARFIEGTTKLISSGGSQPAQLWDLTMTTRPGNYTKNYIQPKLKTRFDTEEDYLYAMAISKNGKWLATGGEKGMVSIYQVESGRLERTISPKPNQP